MGGGTMVCIISKGVHYFNRGAQWCVLSPRGYIILIGGHSGVFYLQGGTLCNMGEYSENTDDEITMVMRCP